MPRVGRPVDVAVKLSWLAWTESSTQGSTLPSGSPPRAGELANAASEMSDTSNDTVRALDFVVPSPSRASRRGEGVHGMCRAAPNPSRGQCLQGLCHDIGGPWSTNLPVRHTVHGPGPYNTNMVWFVMSHVDAYPMPHHHRCSSIPQDGAQAAQGLKEGRLGHDFHIRSGPLGELVQFLDDLGT